MLRPLLALSLQYTIDSSEGISRRPPARLERFTDPVTRSFHGATARWLTALERGVDFLGFRAQIYFPMQIWSSTEESGGVLLLCLC
ncbi:hypothetical protein Bca52824_056081 [Brassica carinata]|uniref:Uncharacterized protein n=2 Tax=Brassica TaxID=3705 RepID=A0A8X7UDH4_BRACI|nr:hypothetical protein Bca52824_056081 [Brassica carinata]